MQSDSRKVKLAHYVNLRHNNDVQLNPYGWIVSRSQAAFSSFIFGREEKGSGNLTLEFPCYKIPRIWELLIGDDKAKRSVNSLCVT